MKNNKRIARTVGILFIIGTLAGILSVVFSGSLLDSSDYLTKLAQNETQMTLGSLCVLVMAFSLAMIPIVLFPIFRKFNEILALGAVLFRGALEAFLYIGVAVSWLVLIALSHDYTTAMDTTSLETMGALVQSAENWITHVLSIVFSLGALMIYWLFYTSRLIPRWLALWGLFGAILYLMVPLLAMFGMNQFGALMAPLAIQEMVLAIWLIVKGFATPMISSEKTT